VAGIADEEQEVVCGGLRFFLESAAGTNGRPCGAT